MNTRLTLAAVAVILSALPALACSLAPSSGACERQRRCAEQPWYLTPFCYLGANHHDQTPDNQQEPDNQQAR